MRPTALQIMTALVLLASTAAAAEDAPAAPPASSAGSPSSSRPDETVPTGTPVPPQPQALPPHVPAGSSPSLHEPHNLTDCARADLLNTARTIEINPGAPLHLGLKTYPQTLALTDHEVVLTFDDGPWPKTTTAVLDALRRECVHATFFLIGRNAQAHPELVRREIADGHAVGNHSFSHPEETLRRLSDVAARHDIDAGIEAVEKAGWPDQPRPPDHPHVPFFRFPGFADTPPLLSYLDREHIDVFGTDLWAADWNRMTPDFELKRVMALLDRPGRHGGIILFHDTKESTAAMLPAFLRALKAGGYKVVCLKPSDTAPLPQLEHAPADWSSETDRIIAHLRGKLPRTARHAPDAPPGDVRPDAVPDPSGIDP